MDKDIKPIPDPVVKEKPPKDRFPADDVQPGYDHDD